MAVKKVQRCTRASLQKPAPQMLKSKERQKQSTAANETGRKAVIIAQEIKFARLLSSNDKKVRDKVLKNLRKWLTVRSKSSFAFTEQDFMRLWKGLFYCMWMSDKPLIQEELAESLSKIVHCFNIKDVVLLYTACVLKTLGTEWFGIDQYRLDKFSMLVRRIIRQTFEKCKERSWDPEWTKGISEVLEKILLDPKVCLGFNMHLTQLFWEELSKISGGEISEDVATDLVRPFISHFLIMDDERQIRHVTRHIFRYLIFQSDIGMDYTEKFEAWKAAGFPAGTIDAMERIEVSDGEVDDDDDAVEEEECPREQAKANVEKPLDPRAGRVNVELPQIPFSAKKIAALLAQYKFHPSSTTKSRRQLRRLIKEFTELSQGKMPLGVKEIRIPRTQKKDTDSKRAVVRLFEFEKQLYSDNAQKKRKRKKNGLPTQDENGKLSGEENSDVDDQDCTAEVDEIESTGEKKKVQHNVNINSNATRENSQASDADITRSKKRKYETKERNQSKAEVKNGNCKSKKDSSLSIKSSSNCKKMKVKKNKTVPESALNVALVKRKKTAAVKLSDKWDISDNVVPSMPALLNDNSAESRTDAAETLVTDDSTKTSNTFDKGPAWLVPALKKLQNEKLQRTPVSTKHQPKVKNYSKSKKRVKIALQRNTAQRTSEYILQVRKSPSIPYDANRKPLAGVLKASPIPSPINPFYKKNSKCPMN